MVALKKFSGRFRSLIVSKARFCYAHGKFCQRDSKVMRLLRLFRLRLTLIVLIWLLPRAIYAQTVPTQDCSLPLPSFSSGCKEHPAPPAEGDAFAVWRQTVVEERSKSQATDATGDRPLKLDPPLPPSLWRISFSPDGRYVLGQDESSIAVVDRDAGKVMLQRFTLGSPVRLARIVTVGQKTLLVLTADQIVHRLPLPE
jgi:hypothetical protein